MLVAMTVSAAEWKRLEEREPCQELLDVIAVQVGAERLNSRKCRLSHVEALHPQHDLNEYRHLTTT